MAAIGTVCALAAVAAVVPGVEHVIGAALIATAMAWLAVWAGRRERRIRRRLLADRRDRPTPSKTSLPASSAAGAAARTGGTP